MKKKIIAVNLIIFLIMLLVVFGFGVVITKNNNVEYANEQVKNLTKAYSNYYKETRSVQVDEKNIRVTIIDSDGFVIYDNFNLDVGSMENHISREEIKSAINGQSKTVIRRSNTLKKELLYYAEKVTLSDNSYVFIRIAVPIQDIDSYVFKSIPLMLFIVIIAFFIEIVISMLITTSILKPLSSVKDSLQSLNKGTFKSIIPTEKDANLNEIINQINELSEKLSATIKESNFEKQKLDYILNHITNGVIALNERGDVVLANENAFHFLDITNQVIGKSYLSISDNKDVLQNLSNALKEESSVIFDVEINERYYVITFKNTENGYYILVIADITDTKKNEVLRNQFFANASHELKTPLTSLRGFNELALLSEKDETIKSYLLQMDKDISRVLVLIDDMLKLSKLEHTKPENITTVSMRELAKEVIDELKISINGKNLNVSIVGDGTVNANKDDIFILQKNLIENAVHYTDKNGKIDVIIDNSYNQVKFTVKDNGIGIDSAHHARIFERFYRVEKSRSRATGGTGLGLSIVKHIAERYNANISLDSKLGVGTAVTVEFNK